MVNGDKQITQYLNAFKLMNGYFFKNSLNIPILSIVRKKGAKGYFRAESFLSKNDENILSEIALNPELFARDDKEILSTLLHEMCHLWQYQFGEPSGGNYHNKEFHKKMLECGLETYDTLTNKEVGSHVTHRIVIGGKFDQFYKQHIKDDIFLIKTEVRVELKPDVKKNKTTYNCENCNFKVWGKPGLVIICGECGDQYIENN